jgi:hypothetical protein
MILLVSACSTLVTPTVSSPTPAVAATPATKTTTPSPAASANATATAAATDTAIETPSAIETPGPQAVVQSFYDWWLARQVDGDNDFPTRPELAPAFAKATREYMHEAFSIEPFLCVQDGPVDRVLAGEATIEGSTANVIITFTLAGENQRKVELVRGSAGWQITAVRCDLL